MFNKKETSHSKTQQRVFQEFDKIGNFYYIHSANDNGFVLKPLTSESGGNPDGTYYIMPRNLKKVLLVEVANAGIKDGDNVLLWVPSNHACQVWKANIITEESLLI